MQLLLLFLMGGIASTATAQTLSCAQTLNFGKIVACAGTHTLTLSPAGALTPSGCLSTLGGHQVGRCQLNDLTDTATISIDPLATIEGPASQQMNMDDFMLRAASGGAADSTLLITPEMADFGFDFTIGATLHVSSGQQGGHYDGLYGVTVNYE